MPELGNPNKAAEVVLFKRSESSARSGLIQRHGAFAYKFDRQSGSHLYGLNGTSSFRVEGQIGTATNS